MKTIASIWTEKIEENNGIFLSFSSVWNVYKSKIGQSKKSRVYKDVQAIFTDDKNIKKIWAKVGTHGRSQHSKTEILLFDVTAMTESDLENAGIEYCGTFFEREKFHTVKS